MPNRFLLAYFKAEGNLAHVFISYVRENRDVVDRLTNELRNRGVTVWLDRNDIDPGARWRDAISRAIQSGSFFVACFSEEYNERIKTYMNEELTIAIDELRKRPSDKTWFIPILINETKIPSRRISAVENLSDIQAINLQEDWDVGISRILRVLRYDDPVLARIWKLLEILDGPFIDERRHAIEQLGDLRIAEKPVIAALIKAAKENDLEIKKASLEALGKIPGAAEAVPALIAALEDPGADVGRIAIQALGRIGPGAVSAVPALVVQLEKGHNRLAAAKALGEIGPGAAEAVPALIAVVNFAGWSDLKIAALGMDRVETDVRLAAAEALGRIEPGAHAGTLERVKSGWIP
jgi:hypothetical protein